MSQPNPHVMALESARAFFEKTASCLEESDSGFTPKEGLFTVAQQVAHTAQVVDWFIEGAFEREDGCDMDFEGQARAVFAVTSLKEAYAWLDRAFKKATEVIASKTEAELNEPFGDQIMGDKPKSILVGAIADHTAHHRGALTIYARLVGKEPPMPYM